MQYLVGKSKKGAERKQKNIDTIAEPYTLQLEKSVQAFEKSKEVKMEIKADITYKDGTKETLYASSKDKVEKDIETQTENINKNKEDKEV